MRLDELTKSEIAEFKKADCFYAIIELAQNQYEIVKLAKDEVEFDEYGDPTFLNGFEPDKFKHAYWFDDEDEANDYVQTLHRQDKLVVDLRSAIEQSDELLAKLKNEKV